MNAMFPELNLPGFTITPFLTERVEYESNIFQTPSRARDDVISKTIPGVLLSLPVGPHRFDLGTRMEILRYADNERQDTEHFFVLGNLLLDFPGGLKLRASEDFARTSTPPGTELTGRIDSSTNTLGAGAEYSFADRYAVGVDYRWTHVDFTSTVDRLDRDEHLIGLTGYYRVQPKTDLLLNYSYGTLDYDSATERDASRYYVLGGVRGFITAQLISTLRLGWEHRESDRRAKSDFNGLAIMGDLVWKPLDRTTVSLAIDRSDQESTFATNFFYVSTIFTLSAQHQMNSKLRLSGRVFGGTNDYPDKAAKVDSRVRDWRSDGLVGYGLGADYQIQRWLGVGLDWITTHRNSNFNNFDYMDSIVGARVTLSF
jgi:hypothetical protein